ncbi:Exosome complex component rrp45 [Taphrina deformans PYCC 5710]|uniref:Exosome complex component RRP45 n=1 Tax=Taphrina deformans (strain PYCC 5710 / ATCC 11124 / CBS 356.35 / IMI 108563 / JCM 9778 / NBRC 8474) TaxID=1097556 RepID=R4XD28_TAPDE|nr:Exosome complex component rrp45 [Taphrina deformans PYCC 5710]|eukprot:CCG82313.1 Exosome complex component rrp45 [Taphrina deformans PYCC 5710]
MPRDLEPSHAESQFVLEALEEQLRLDFRGASEFRKLSLSFGSEYGLVEVLLGETRVLCRVTATIVRPFEDRPFDGQFIVNTEMSAFVGQSRGPGQNEEELLISRTLEKSVRRSRALDTESLCIVAGKQCWQIRADIHFLNNEGNLLDAACLALTTSLLHFRRPDTKVHGEQVTVYTLKQRVPVPLQLTHLPICLTFSFFSHGKIVLIDASRQEEILRSGEISITMNKSKELSQINKAGGVAITPDVLMKCLNIAVAKTQELTKVIEDAVKNDLRSKEEQFIGGQAESDRVQGVDDRPGV